LSFVAQERIFQKLDFPKVLLQKKNFEDFPSPKRCENMGDLKTVA
jgi:hypothetical protein